MHVLEGLVDVFTWIPKCVQFQPFLLYSCVEAYIGVAVVSHPCPSADKCTTLAVISCIAVIMLLF